MKFQICHRLPCNQTPTLHPGQLPTEPFQYFDSIEERREGDVQVDRGAEEESSGNLPGSAQCMDIL